ncbi:unnamed protein product [Allacma fusca]|uniref:Uncharacterized protein n=1 Tax=Allacma fusca TaxID=39272 RepID=A0A8J2P783_9HEXA|nr:unnamed protein product [Allacma fusca]
MALTQVLWMTTAPFYVTIYDDNAYVPFETKVKLVKLIEKNPSWKFKTLRSKCSTFKQPCYKQRWIQQKPERTVKLSKIWISEDGHFIIKREVIERPWYKVVLPGGSSNIPDPEVAAF